MMAIKVVTLILIIWAQLSAGNSNFICNNEHCLHILETTGQQQINQNVESKLAAGDDHKKFNLTNYINSLFLGPMDLTEQCQATKIVTIKSDDSKLMVEGGDGDSAKIEIKYTGEQKVRGCPYFQKVSIMSSAPEKSSSACFLKQKTTSPKQAKDAEQANKKNEGCYRSVSFY